MGQSVDPVTQLNDCGCCEGLSVESPTVIENRPGLSAIAYRIGTFTQFKDTMLARLSGSNQPALKQLTTRYDDDFSIALLDSWATVADVLTFYQERIANESYLRTATERLSVLELARLIGYQLRPGVAASTYLAFVLDDVAGTLGQALSIGTTAQNSSDPLPPITIAVGTKVQSVPAPGEQAQTFETVEPISARPEWNQIEPRLTWPQPLVVSANFVIFKGTSTNLKQGDRLLIRDGTNTPQVKIILTVTLDSQSNTTRVDFVSPPSQLPAYVRPVGLPIGTLNDFLSKTNLDEIAVKQIVAKSWSEDDLSAVASTQNWSTVALVNNISEQTAARAYPAGAGVFAFRQRASIFGHNAQDWNTLPIALRVGEVNPTPKNPSETIIQRIKDLADPLANDLKNAVDPFVRAVRDSADEAVNRMKGLTEDATANVNTHTQATIAAIMTDTDTMLGAINDKFKATIDGINSSIDVLSGSIRDVRDKITHAKFDDAANDLESFSFNRVPAAHIAGLGDMVANVAASTHLFSETTVSAMNDLESAADGARQVIDSIAATARNFKSELNVPASDLQSAFERSARDFVSNVQGLGDSLLQNVQDAVNSFIKGVYADRKNSWADANFTSGTTTIYLDAVYQQIVVGSFIVLTNSTATEIFSVTSVAEETRSDFNMSLKVTRLGISGSNINHFSPRTASVYLQSDLLSLADLPIVDVITGNTVTLDRTYLGLATGQRIILTGERADLEGVTGNESLTLQKVIVEAGFTVLTFDRSFAYSYVRDTVTINANVALATNGETVAEVMGSGDSTQPFQQFALRQPPLTYVSASTPSGAQSTLEVRVNDLLWHEVSSFFEHKPEERIYVTRQDDDDVTTVVFGDGTTGARIPTGQANIQAKYRKGIGLGGLVRADQLTQLMTRPLGVKGVTNPLPSAGAADSEQLDDARTNAPLTVLTLDRVVSLQDYEDFARAFSGIGKSLATWTWFGEKRGIFVTVAGSDGAEVLEGSDLQTKLLGAMRQFGDPLVPLVVKSYQPRFFKITATIKVAPDFLPDIVLASVEQKLRDAYSFNARAMGQPVHLSEVIGVMQNIAGVVAVDVQDFYRSDQAASKEVHIPAAFPQQGNTTLDPAELLTLDPRLVNLGVMV